MNEAERESKFDGEDIEHFKARVLRLVVSGSHKALSEWVAQCALCAYENGDIDDNVFHTLEMSDAPACDLRPDWDRDDDGFNGLGAPFFQGDPEDAVEEAESLMAKVGLLNTENADLRQQLAETRDRITFLDNDDLQGIKIAQKQAA